MEEAIIKTVTVKVCGACGAILEYEKPPVAELVKHKLCVLNPEAARRKTTGYTKPLGSRPWTDEEDTALLTKAKNGVPVGRMAEIHGRTRPAISNRLLVFRKKGYRV